MIIAPGQTSVRVHILITNDAGIPVSGLVASTFPAMFYIRDGEARVAITALSDLGAATSGFNPNGVFGYGDGHYRIDVPDAAFATASYVKITGEATDKRVFCPIITVRELPSNVRQLAGMTLTVAGNVITLPAGFRLAPTTVETTALLLEGAPNAYALRLVGGGYESQADTSKGALQIMVANQQSFPVNAVEILKATASTVAVNVTGTIDANIVGNVTGNVSGSVGSATVVNGLAANVITATSIATDAITAAKLATGAITSAKFAADAINAAAIASDAITATKIATGAITSAKFAASAIDAAAIASNAITAAKIATDAITAAALATDAGTEIGTAVWATTTRQLSGVTFPTNFASLGINGSGHISRCVLLDTLTTYTGNTVQTGDSFARIGATGSGLTTLAIATQIPANFTSALFVSAGVFATAALVNAPSGSGPTAVAIRTEMDANSTRLANLDATVSSRASSGQIPANFTTATFVSAGVFATAALANAPSGSGPTAVAIRTEMDANSTKLANLDATVSSRASSGQIPANLTSALFVSAGVFATAALVNAPSGSGPTASVIADAVWDEVLSTHLTPGSTGAALNGGSGADTCTLTFTNPTTLLPIADASVWVSSDLAGNAIVAGTRQTNSNGKVIFLLNSGATYYAWLQKDGVNQIRGQIFVALRD